jgi:Zn finger protein HypA/HybF involved in hydrogenase expression
MKTLVLVRKRVRVRVRCSECGRRWSVAPSASTPQCARCNSVDVAILDSRTQEVIG